MHGLCVDDADDSPYTICIPIRIIQLVILRMFGRKKASQDTPQPTERPLTQRERNAAKEETVARLPIGRSGTSRVDEELLAVHPTTHGVESWRIFKIMSELVSGFELLRGHNFGATIFGTSRCQFGDEVYTQAEELAGCLAREGFTVVTGGGDGVMGAANKGAKEAGGQSVGLNIKLPTEQQANSHTTDGMEFNYFFTRKVMLAYASEVYVFFPGGFGTLDELFEIMTLVQTKKIKPIPVILIGKAYWGPLVSWFSETLYEEHQAISREDLDIFHLVDSVDEAMDVIRERVTT